MEAFLQWWETFSLTRLYFSPEIMARAFPVILRAFPVSIAFGLFAFAFGIPLGLLLAFMKISKRRLLRWPATFFVDIVRGTPLFLQVLIIYFGLPLMPFYQTIVGASPWMQQSGPLGLTWTIWFRGLFILSFNSSAYMAEIFRAGIQSIHKGQMEAARSLGMTLPVAMMFVIIPQTIRRILPTMMSEFILLFKDTALLAAVGVGEMVLRAREVAATSYNASPYVLAAAFYLVVTIPLGRLVARYEEKLAASEGGGAAVERPDKETVKPATVPGTEHR